MTRLPLLLAIAALAALAATLSGSLPAQAFPPAPCSDDDGLPCVGSTSPATCGLGRTYLCIVTSGRSCLLWSIVTDGNSVCLAYANSSVVGYRD